MMTIQRRKVGRQDTIICENNVIPGTNVSVKLDMHFIHSTTREIHIYITVAWLIPKENSSYCVLNVHLA